MKVFFFLPTSTSKLSVYYFMLIENDHLCDWSPEKDCFWRLTFRQPVRKPSSESTLNTAQVVETSVANNNPSQDSHSSQPDDHFQSRYFTPGSKPFCYLLFYAFTILLGQHVSLLSCNFEFASNLWRAFFKGFFI